MIVVVKIGTSSVTTIEGSVDERVVGHLCAEVAELRRLGHQVVVVTSGAVTAGVSAFRPDGGRPTDAITLQALSAIGQPKLMRVYDDSFANVGLTCAQVLITPQDFGERRQYLHARSTLARLLELGVVPVVNENDAIADDEIRFGDNDRIAALVANLLGAQLLVLLTDMPGLYDADPRLSSDASLVEEVTEIDEALEHAAGGPGSVSGSGGMASKLAAARIASWSGVRVAIAKADRPCVLADLVAHRAGVGTVIPAQARELPARKLWIAFALPVAGRVAVDDGAREALLNDAASLLPQGVQSRSGEWQRGEAVEVTDLGGQVFAKGITQLSSEEVDRWISQDTPLPRGTRELVHRDDLVVLIGATAQMGRRSRPRRGAPQIRRKRLADQE